MSMTCLACFPADQNAFVLLHAGGNRNPPGQGQEGSVASSEQWPAWRIFLARDTDVRLRPPVYGLAWSSPTQRNRKPGLQLLPGRVLALIHFCRLHRRRSVHGRRHCAISTAPLLVKPRTPALQ